MEDYGMSDFYKELADQIFFSKEAAEYLGISMQRLNKLVQDGKITPLKRSVSATLFHVDELNKRKRELEIFTTVEQEGGKGMFRIDTRVKQEALNFATLMNVLKRTEHSLEPDFDEFSKINDVTIPLSDKSLIGAYEKTFKINQLMLLEAYDKAERAFKTLRETDEIIKRGSDDYPPLLAQTEQAPRFLYIRGRKSLLFEKRTVALVGSRQASRKAQENTARLARILGENGITVISGLAKGIDVAGHVSALKNGFNTIAVIGTNLNQYYPKENENVQREIEKRGLVISQFSPANQTERWFFPLRNGVMSGLSLATVIMEAGETSGALKQADFALKQKRLILIPASALHLPNVTWPQRYVERGAQVVNNSTEILKALSNSHIFKVDSEPTQQTLSDYLKDKETEKYVQGSLFDWFDSVTVGE